jgi:hypothetical protein
LLVGPRPALYSVEVCWFHQGNGTETWRFLFRPHWRRGFVEAIACTADDCEKHLAAILAAQPVQTVGLTTWPQFVEPTDAEGRPIPSFAPRYRELCVQELRKRWPRVARWTLPILSSVTEVVDRG